MTLSNASTTRHVPADPLEQQEALRDMMGVLAIPSLCRGRTRAEVLDTLLDALSVLLPGSASLARTRLGEQPIERTRPLELDAAMRSELQRMTAQPMGLEVQIADIDIASSHGDSAKAVIIPLGFYGDTGALVVVTGREIGEAKRSLVLRTLGALGAAALENALLLESLNEANSRKDKFLALLGHELRNPLAPIKTAVALMREREPGPDRLRDAIERQVEHMGHLVDDLLDISRITRGELLLRRAPVELREVIGHAVEQVSPLLRERRHHLTVTASDPGAPPLVVDGDAFRLSQVFANLLTNAARYTDPGGNVHVAVIDAGGRARICVQDDGRGISAEMLERIFEPFVQAEPERDGFRGGIGLGLAIVRTLVDLHGGRVAAFSPGPGKGTEVVVELPLVGEKGAALSAALSASAPPAMAIGATTTPLPRVARNVLLVDDNEELTELLAEFIMRAGHNVVVAGDAEEALARAAESAFDVAFLDLGLPRMDGFELCTALRARLGAELRVIAVSGYGDDDARARSTRVGFNLHLLKPADPKRILAVIEEAPRSTSSTSPHP